MIVVESVDEILKPWSDGNLKCLWGSLGGIGYAGASKIVKAQSLGLPFARVRAYFVVFDCAAFGYTVADARNRVVETREMVDLFQVAALPLTKLWLKKTEPRLATELSRKQEATRANSKKSLRFQVLYIPC